MLIQEKAAGNAGVTKVQFDAVVVGAGFAGLYMLKKLRDLGMKVRVYESASAIGGTWYWNRYPGARCDTESVDYSYSFSDDLQQEWKWTERYAAQPEILRYINHAADKFDLRRDVQLSTRVVSAEFDETVNRWTIQTNHGETISARFCIMATGCLSAAKVPDIKGRECFEGNWYHSGLWPEDGADFSDQRVGVIGTGSSAVQLIPHVARQAKQLFVFQRTANFIVPAQNSSTRPEEELRYKAEYPQRREQARKTAFCMSGHPAPTKSALEDSHEEQQRAYEAGWARGGAISFLAAYTDLLVNKEANETACEFVRGKIRKTVRDPAVAEMLSPNSHYIGTKRLCLDTGYYETYNRDNVTLVDVKTAPIKEITSRGIRTGAGEYQLDAIIFATGFDAMTGALLDMDIRGVSGKTLKTKWANGPLTYLGLMTAGFPNMFIITGPGSPSVKSNMVCAIEQHVEWIADCVRHVRSKEFARIDADPESENTWVQHVNEVANRTLYPLADSWYVGSNIPGKPRVFMPYVGGLDTYRKKCDQVAASGYEGFLMTR
jgi:cyclohexanone monooxygenase